MVDRQPLPSLLVQLGGSPLEVVGSQGSSWLSLNCEPQRSSG